MNKTRKVTAVLEIWTEQSVSECVTFIDFKTSTVATILRPITPKTVVENLIRTLTWHHRSFNGMDSSANRLFTPLLLHHLPPLPSLALYHNHWCSFSPFHHWFASSSSLVWRRASKARQIPAKWVKKWIIDLKQTDFWLSIGIAYWSHLKKNICKILIFKLNITKKSIPVMAAVAVRKKVVSSGQFSPCFHLQSLKSFFLLDRIKSNCMYWLHWKSGLSQMS